MYPPRMQTRCGRIAVDARPTIGGKTMKYVLYDGTPMLRLPDGTGLSREDCLH